MLARLIVLLVNVSVVALPTSVSVAFGKLIVLSAVGSTTVRVVSWSSAVAPSNTISEERAIAPVTDTPVDVVSNFELLLCLNTTPPSAAKVAIVSPVYLLTLIKLDLIFKSPVPESSI